MLLSPKPNYGKLKTNLRLAKTRLQHVEKKKLELSQTARKEIADYVAAEKCDRARIRVQHIVREDYTVEAYELLDSFCATLIDRYGLIEQVRGLDPGLEEAVNSIIWAAVRIQNDIPELKAIVKEFKRKYGRDFVHACRADAYGKVNPKIIQKLSVLTPSKLIIERYMIEIAKCHKVPFTPDADALGTAEETELADLMAQSYVDNAKNAYGWKLPHLNDAECGPNFSYRNNRGNGRGGSPGGGTASSTRVFDYPARARDTPPSPSAPPAYWQTQNGDCQDEEVSSRHVHFSASVTSTTSQRKPEPSPRQNGNPPTSPLYRHISHNNNNDDVPVFQVIGNRTSPVVKPKPGPYDLDGASFDTTDPEFDALDERFRALKNNL